MSSGMTNHKEIIKVVMRTVVFWGIRHSLVGGYHFGGTYASIFEDEFIHHKPFHHHENFKSQIRNVMSKKGI
jgi:hypothetical protein